MPLWSTVKHSSHTRYACCRHTTLGELHVYTGLVSKTTGLRINMSCVSCSLQASPHKYDVTTLPIDTVFCHGYKPHSIKQSIFIVINFKLSNLV